MRRTVTFKDEGISFSISCRDCPLLPALETLGQNPRPCISGLITNMQGFVPVAECEHYQKDSIDSQGAQNLSVECRKGDA
jgi:hypothetical protein